MSEKTTRKSPTLSRRKSKEELVANVTKTGLLGDNHEPPIGIGGCSFFFDVPENFFTLSDPTEKGAFKKYSFTSKTGQSYTAISSISILTETREVETGITFTKLSPTESQNAKLRLWLSTTRDEPTQSEPDVIIDGDGGGSIMINTTLLAPIKLAKHLRTARYKHPNSNVSVVKWELVSVSGDAFPIKGTKEIAQASKDDLYYIHVGFAHHH